MIRITNLAIPIRFLVAAVLAFAISGCGSDGSDGAPGAPGKDGEPGPSGAPTTELNMTIDSASINSKPVVNFSVTDQDGNPFTGLSLSDLRFTVAKLMPASVSRPSAWQNYIVRVETPDPTVGPGGVAVLPGGAVQGTRENSGTLVNNNDGSYTYTFGTDVATLTCPINAADPITACADGTGKTLDLSFSAGSTHRIGIQTRGSLPPSNATFDFVPSGAAVAVTREMVRTDTCNVCHDKLEAHDARVDVPYCVTCHNPGSIDANSGRSVDFKDMVHKIHYGADLPSVNLGPDQTADTGDEIPYIIWGFRNTPHDFSDIIFPATVRSVSVGTPDLDPADPKFIPASTLACTKCHNADDPKTPDASNFTKPNIEACGSCHDDISFAAVTPDPNDPNRTVPHSGGPAVDDTFCSTCHGPAVLPPLPGTVTKSHIIPERVASACFQYNILDISPQPAQGQLITVRFSVTNPNPGTNPNPEADPCPATTTYDILNDPHFQPAGGARRLVIDVGWDTNDFNNTGGGGTPPSRTIEVNALTTATDVGAVPGTEFEITATVPATANGTGSVAVEGHPACDPVTTSCRAIVQGVVQNFLIDPTPGATITARRQVVDVVTKCDRCHDVLSLHGSNRSEAGDLCVMCHNPNGTDINRRAGLPGGIGIDGKTEESIDFKVLIHALHAASESNFDGTTAHGFRETGIVVYGFGGRPHDYSDLRFPGALWRCETCHLDGTFKLEGTWELPAQNGILGSTIDTGAIVDDPSDDMKISPTAAVCSSCHDSRVAQAHMELNGALFMADQATIADNVEACAVCHGPGKTSSVELVHAEGFGEDIP